MRQCSDLKPFAVLVSLTFVVGCAAGYTPRVRGEIRVLVYNIHAGKDASNVDNLSRVATIVRESAADVVLLQEVDRFTTRSGNVDQVAVLDSLTGYHGVFGKTLDYQGGQYGIAILSRWPIASDTLIHLPIDPPQERAGGSYEPRGALRVTVRSPYGIFGALNTHLDPSSDDHYRRQEIATFVSLFLQLVSATDLAVGGGDLNSEPGSAILNAVARAGLKDSWKECGTGDGFTYPAAKPVKRIDYLILPKSLRCLSARVIATQASDHRPVLFTVTK
jgi:endonuclease/exonuclease/phosphatase family metal-dependent hydrolase